MNLGEHNSIIYTLQVIYIYDVCMVENLTVCSCTFHSNSMFSDKLKSARIYIMNFEKC